jgi:4-hydroxy-tetrahydrodipicolinate synthase
MSEVDRSQWRGLLDGALLPLVPLPRDAEGAVATEALKAYIDWMSKRSAAGVVVGAEVSRPDRLTLEQQDGLLTAWRDGLSGNQAVVAAVGASVNDYEPLPPTERPRRFRDDVLRQARRVLKRGANALWCAPPLVCRGHAREADLIVDYYDKLAKLGAPLFVGIEAEVRPGLPYGPETIRRVLESEAVVALQMPASPAIGGLQSAFALLRREFPDLPLLTAENGHTSYCLMMGAGAAMLELGACCTDTVAEMVKTHADNRYHRFHALVATVEALSRVVYAPPAGAHVQRLLWCLELTGIISADAAFDPAAPELPEDAREQVRTVLEEIGELEPERKPRRTDEEELDEFLTKRQQEAQLESGEESG